MPPPQWPPISTLRNLLACQSASAWLPSPTGFLHVGNVRTALFNWLFARHEGGEFLLRIENTDTGREVAEATEQIQSSLRWLGLDWDGEVTFQLDRLERCQAEAHRLVEEGAGVRGRRRRSLPHAGRGLTAWDDLVLGPIEIQNETIEDVVILRSDGRPTYNFASPVEDWLDGITHVIRGQDHVPNTPKQIEILTRARRRAAALRARPDSSTAPTGRSLSKRHGSVTTDEFRAQRLPARRARQLPRAARLELRRQDDDHVPRRARRALLARARVEEPGRLRLREAHVDERRLPARAARRREYARRARSAGCASRATTGTRSSSGERRRSCRRRSRCSRSSPASQASSSHRWSRTRPSSTAASTCSAAAADALTAVEPFTRRGDRGRAARPGGRARAQAARCVSADPDRGHGLEGLARALREHRAARARRDRAAPTGGTRVATSRRRRGPPPTGAR